MNDFNTELRRQLTDAISLQRDLLNKLLSGTLPEDHDKLTIDIVEKTIKNATAINKFYETILITDDNEKYETYLKSLDNKDINIY